ncbi:MAG: phosphate ABC transporter substrate-binding protein [Bacteroidales bacterium]|nr:phosphate ABC transporter substrate-binding protein [Bacteroidales bacterium]
MKIKNLLLILLILLSISNCSRFNLIKTNTIRIKGSDTMRILTSRWAEEYMKYHPNISVYAEGRGSAMGIKDLINGKTDICAASRPLRPNEAHQLAKVHGKLGMGFLVAKDVLSVYINPENPVRDLSLKQLKDIFTGKITNWKEVGGKNEPILVLTRSPNSGTYLYFKEHVLEGDSYSTFAQTLQTTAAIVKAISENHDAIGYGGIAYGPEVVHCKINGVAATEENVINDTYPIVRYLYLYTIDTPRRQTKDFIDWVLKDGQKIVKKVGYIPLWQVP